MSKERIQNLLEQLCVNLYEREEVMALTLLSAIAGESIFLYGESGTGKSLIAKKITTAFKHAFSIEIQADIENYFDKRYFNKDDLTVCVLNNITNITPLLRKEFHMYLDEKLENVFFIGNDNKNYSINSEDEILKTNLINNKISFGYEMNKINNDELFFKMLENNKIYSDNIDESLKISNEELNQWRNDIETVKLSKETMNVISEIRNNNNVYDLTVLISDAKWVKLIKLLKTSALLNNRKETDLSDCYLLMYSYYIKSNVFYNIILKIGYKIDFTNLDNLIEEYEKITERTVSLKEEDKDLIILVNENNNLISPEFVDKIDKEIINLNNELIKIKTYKGNLKKGNLFVFYELDETIKTLDFTENNVVELINKLNLMKTPLTKTQQKEFHINGEKNIMFFNEISKLKLTEKQNFIKNIIENEYKFNKYHETDETTIKTIKEIYGII